MRAFLPPSFRQKGGEAGLPAGKAGRQECLPHLHAGLLNVAELV